MRRIVAIFLMTALPAAAETSRWQLNASFEGQVVSETFLHLDGCRLWMGVLAQQVIARYGDPDTQTDTSMSWGDVTIECIEI